MMQKLPTPEPGWSAKSKTWSPPHLGILRCIRMNLMVVQLRRRSKRNYSNWSRELLTYDLVSDSNRFEQQEKALALNVGTGRGLESNVQGNGMTQSTHERPQARANYEDNVWCFRLASTGNASTNKKWTTGVNQKYTNVRLLKIKRLKCWTLLICWRWNPLNETSAFL